MRAISDYIGFAIALIIIVVLLIPLFLVLTNYSSPSTQQINYYPIISNQVNGGGVPIYYNATPKGPTIMVFKQSGNYTLFGVYCLSNGKIYNITQSVGVITISPSGKVTNTGKSLPVAMVYNFTVPAQYWNYTLILQLKAYQTTVYATLYPNTTALV
ncbi:hypothetical protein [Sulfolobus acidocaldarius]|nr:hypothetical protein [Sulfolobus acidocaldarius]AGE71598.1 hypothetical protein SacN8_08190 [Sulfolobus acidocaldarius N8]AGE73871.1 hypothetical protein SacRon12I_08200 [Sulfolobus acidocaldarius Ron12/I]ALU30180.1 hypothetical protein ATY89_09685 [Sulfolobus acidocaldarius]ALU32735.1 hypothetical protein ATZ20_01245 [Sulfolobus acidocaldarius]WCM35502.1 hypothetical protein GO597_09265 [Sulfolobus acidocaldarius DSM 639]